MKTFIACAAGTLLCATFPTFATPSSAHPDNAGRARSHGALQDARQQVTKSAQVLLKMKNDPQAAQLLRQAKGVLILPDYGRGALVVGAGGGPGVLVARHDGTWTGPALYNVGTVSIGAQAGGSGGSAAILLMSDKALRQFEQDNDFALDADAGITVWNRSARGRARTGGDIAMWSDTKGLYAGASVGATDINYDEHETAALYGRSVAPSQVLSGHVRSAQAANRLMQELPTA
jgi:SH3 domain-containing YSC84-like protein 1